MVFSTDETTNKAVVYAGIPENGEKFKQLEVSEWLNSRRRKMFGLLSLIIIQIAV